MKSFKDLNKEYESRCFNNWSDYYDFTQWLSEMRELYDQGELPNWFTDKYPLSLLGIEEDEHD